MEQADQYSRLDPIPVQNLFLQKLQLGPRRTAVVRDGVLYRHTRRLRERIWVPGRSLEPVVDGHATPPGLVQVRHEIHDRRQHLVHVHVYHPPTPPPPPPPLFPPPPGPNP